MHRLIQSETDGKLVELPSASGVAAAIPESSHTDPSAISGKVDALSLEYSDLIVSQLDSQRSYYEHRLQSIRSEHVPRSDFQTAISERDDMRRINETAIADIAVLRAELASKQTTTERLDKQLRKALETTRTLRKQYDEEKSVSDALSTRAERLQSDQESMQREMTDLKDNLRDLMFYVSASEKIQQSGSASQLSGGDAYVAPRNKR